MHPIDYGVIIVFAMIVFASGMAFTGSGKSMKSFFAAGGMVPWWLSGLSLFMSFFSAGTFVVWGAIAYELGWVAITIQWMMGLAGFLIAFFIAPRWKKTNALTVAEYITRRFGVKAQKFYSYIFLLLSFTYTGAFLYPIAKLVNVSTGWPIHTSIIGLGVLIIIYTAAGGLWAVIITDVLQFIILTAGVLIVVPLAFEKVGGVGTFIDQAPAGFFNLVSGEYSGGFLVAFGLYNLAFIGGNWAYVQRYTSVADERNAKKVGLTFGILYLISPILWMMPPMIYQVLNPGLIHLQNEGAYLLMCKEVLPKGLLGLLLGGMIFATASSVNTTLNTSAAVFTNDLYKPLFSSIKTSSLIGVGRLATVFFGILTIIFALFVPKIGGIVEVVLSVGALTGAPLYAPPIWALFSQRINSRAIVVTTLGSLLINAFFKFVTPEFGLALSRAQEMLVGVGIPIVFLLYFETFNRPQVAAVSGLSPPLEEAQDTNSQNSYAMKVISVAIFLIALLTILIGLMAEKGQLLTVAMGTVLAVVAIAIYRKRN